MIKKFVLGRTTTVIHTTIAELMSVGMQGNDLVVWVDSATPHFREWTFTVALTGEPSPPHAVYVGTVQHNDIVMHVYAN